MKPIRNAAIVTLAVAVSACGGPKLTKEALDVRSVTDAADCTLIESSYLESRPQFIQDYVKRNVARMGGDSYKIINVSHEMVAGVQIAMVSFEAYRCRK